MSDWDLIPLYEDILSGPAERGFDNWKFVERFIRSALTGHHLITRAGLQAFCGFSDQEMKEWQESEPYLFEWFDVAAQFFNMDRAARKGLDSKMVTLALLNESAYISSRAGEKDTGPKDMGRKILTLELLGKEVKDEEGV